MESAETQDHVLEEIETKKRWRSCAPPRVQRRGLQVLPACGHCERRRSSSYDQFVQAMLQCDAWLKRCERKVTASRWREMIEQKVFRGKLWVAFGMERCVRRMCEHFCFQQYLFSLFEEGGNCPPDTWCKNEHCITCRESKLAISVRSAWALDSAS